MHSYQKTSPMTNTGKLFIKNKESIEETLIRKMKEKYISREVLEAE